MPYGTLIIGQHTIRNIGNIDTRILIMNALRDSFFIHKLLQIITSAYEVARKLDRTYFSIVNSDCQNVVIYTEEDAPHSKFSQLLRNLINAIKNREITEASNILNEILNYSVPNEEIDDINPIYTYTCICYKKEDDEDEIIDVVDVLSLERIQELIGQGYVCEEFNSDIFADLAIEYDEMIESVKSQIKQLLYQYYGLENSN